MTKIDPIYAEGPCASTVQFEHDKSSTSQEKLKNNHQISDNPYPLKLTFPPNVSAILQHFFYRLGYQVALRPVYFILAAVIILIACASGLYRMIGQEQPSLPSLYTIIGGQTEREHAAFDEFFPMGTPHKTIVYVRTFEKEGNLLDADRLDFIVNLTHHIQSSCSLVTKENKTYVFDDFCRDACASNDALDMFQLGMTMQKRNIQAKKFISRRVKLGYPHSEVLGVDVNFAPILRGVQTRKSHLKDDDGVLFEHVELVILKYLALEPTDEERSLLLQWEMQLRPCIKKFMANRTDIDVKTVGDAIAANDVLVGAMYTMPYFMVGFGAMFVFVVVVVALQTHRLSNYHIFDSLILTTFAISSPTLAFLAGAGLVCYSGWSLTSIVVVTPFLILAIGVDDAFLLLHSWYKDGTRRMRLVKYSDEAFAAAFAKSVADVSPSITITSITNAIAFGVGIASYTPEVRNFCVATTAAVTFDLLFECILFSPVLALVARKQQRRRKDRASVVVGLSEGNTNKVSRGQAVFAHRATKLLYGYCRLLASPYVAVAMVFILFAYWGVFCYFAYNIVVVLNIGELYLPWVNDTTVSYDLRARYVNADEFPFLVIVNRPVDITNSSDVESFNALLTELDSLQYAMPDRREIWLDDYYEFVDWTKTTEFITGDLEEILDSKYNDLSENRTSYDLLPLFLEQPAYYDWHQLLHYTVDEKTHAVTLNSFAFRIHYSGQKDWHIRMELLPMVRDAVNKFPQFNATLYDKESYLIDQMLTIKWSTSQTILYTLASMAVVCTLFIPNISSVFCAMLAISSISMGVIGGLSMLGVNLDPVSMITIIMSIGLSVDYVAHVSYHFWHTTADDVETRLYDTLRSVALPTVQAGFSTVLTVSALALVPLGMSTTFFKTVALVVSLGIVHGLCVVPVLLAAISKMMAKCC